MKGTMNLLNWLFGLGVEAQHLALHQILIRAVVIFFATLLIVRIADKRFFAKKTAFDLILGLILASMMARAINGSERLFPTIAAGFLLAFLHRGLGQLACRSKRFGVLVKGSTQTLVEEGAMKTATMQRHRITEDDLFEELRLKGVERPEQAKLAMLERSGEISVVKK
jgi:uncharacterized membrane protein YcaP (DUF421 family)